jgi:nucleotide-binding universal stress UspA family protein
VNGDNLVVGVDGGAAALHAVRWATRECAANGATLVLLHALGHAAGAEPADPERVLAEAEATAHATAAGVTVRRRPERGCPAEVLVAASASARLIVLGTNGVADVAGSMLGTVGHRVATHARCPVVVVPPAAEPVRAEAPVVVGLAPGRAGRAALRFALAHAAERGRSVVGVLAAGDVTGDGRRRHVGPLGIQQILAERPQVRFRASWTDADPASALRTLAADAALLVLGCHHSDEPWSTRLGPVPTALLDRSVVPIALVATSDR